MTAGRTVAAMAALLSVALVADVALCGCATPLTDRRCDELDRRSCGQPAEQKDPLSRYRQAPGAGGVRPPPGGAVNVGNVVVTAIDDYLESVSGNTGDVWVQQVFNPPVNFEGCAPMPDGRRVCGIQLFAPTFVPAGSALLTGDLVTVTGGRYDEFDCTVCCRPPANPCRFMDRILPEFSQASVERVGTGVAPVVVPTTIETLASGGDNYTGVLVNIPGEIMLTMPARGDIGRGEIPIANSGGMKLSAQIGALVDRASGRPIFDVENNRLNFTRLRNVTGIVSYFFGNKLLPRGPQDFEALP